MNALAEYQKQEFASKPICFYERNLLASQQRLREELESIRFIKANRFVQQLRTAFLAKLEKYRNVTE